MHTPYQAVPDVTFLEDPGLCCIPASTPAWLPEAQETRAAKANDQREAHCAVCKVEPTILICPVAAGWSGMGGRDRADVS